MIAAARQRLAPVLPIMSAIPITWTAKAAVTTIKRWIETAPGLWPGVFSCLTGCGRGLKGVGPESHSPPLFARPFHVRQIRQVQAALPPCHRGAGARAASFLLLRHGADGGGDPPTFRGGGQLLE